MKSRINSSSPPKPAGGKTAWRTSTRRAWRFRLLAVMLVPLLLVLGELVLRLFGYGYSPRFFLPARVRGQDVFVNNPRYGWRFASPSLAREPAAFTLPQAKAPGTIRIFVLGESAALGDPDARFGLSRMLEALLNLRYPQHRFEVVCGAFAAISSHVIAAVAQECAGQSGDAWVIYAGNNEVVGPFGAGSVFGLQAPPRPLIRASVALKTTRLGQWLNATFDGLRRGAAPPADWKGMETMLHERVSQRDPRIGRVYDNFRENLRETLAAAKHAGVKVVLSTMGTNLRDCSPFASAHGASLGAAELVEWDRAFQNGVAREEQGDRAGALESYRNAAALNAGHAELQFRTARCLLALGQPREADEHFRAARDADTLRFRADSRINDLIRVAAKDAAGQGLRLFDAEALFARQSPDGLPGGEFFYEHVHLTPTGNYLLARGLATELAGLLGLKDARDSAGSGWLSDWAPEADCLRWLGCTGRNLHDLWSLMLERCGRPPFTQQLDHTNHVRWLEERRNAYRLATKPTQLRQFARELSTLVAARPDDPYLRSNFAAHLQFAGDNPRAETAWREAIERLPNSWQLWFNLGNLLAEERRTEDARRCYDRCLELNPWLPEVKRQLTALTRDARK